MDIKILEEYKKRLVNFSGRNQTLKRNKIYSKRAFDLCKANKYEQNLIAAVLSEILNDTAKEVIIVNKNKKITLHKEEIERIEKNYLSLMKNSKKIKALFSEKEMQEVLEKRNNKLILKVQEKLIEEKEENIKDELNNIFRNLDVLKNEIDTVEKETGLYQLYLGYPFIEGKLEDGTDVRAPLFLFPCKLDKKDGKFIYQNLNDSSIYINRSFLLAYSSATRKDFKELKDEYDTVEEIFSVEKVIKTKEEYLDKCIDFLSKNEINIKLGFENEIENYIDFKKESYNKFSRGELYLKNYIVIGQYTIGDNGIYKDYENLCEKKDIEHEVVENLLKYDRNAVYTEDDINTSMGNNIKINEKSSFFITELDYSQEKAIKMAEKLKSLVVYGPPGTGKSQVIANIVSDNLAKEKKVLVVSEKRTALDVVYKRLEKSGLNERIGFVHDIKSDKQKILEKVTNILELVEKQKGNNIIEENINNISEKIENRIRKLDNMKNVLFEKQPCGISLYELYSNSKLKSGYVEEIMNNFEKYDFFDYLKLNEFIDKLENLKSGLKYDLIPIICDRDNFSNKSNIENDRLVTKLQKIDDFYNKNIEEKLIENIKKEKEIVLSNLIEQLHNEKEKFQENNQKQKEETILLLNKEIKQNKENLENKIKLETERLLLETKKELNNQEKKIKNLKEDLEEIVAFDYEIYKDLENLNEKRKEYISLSFISFLKKMKLKKEFIKLDYGNSIEEKLKQIEILKNLEKNNKELLDYMVFELKYQTLKELKNGIEEKKAKIERLKNEVENLKVLNNSLEYTDKTNDDILDLKLLKEKYTLISSPLDIIEQNKENLKIENINKEFAKLDEIKKELVEYKIKNNEKLDKVKETFEELTINNLDKLKLFKENLLKYEFITKAEQLELFIKEIELVFENIEEINNKEILLDNEKIYQNLFDSKKSSLSEAIIILNNEFEKIRAYDIEKIKLNRNELKIFKLYQESVDYDKFIKNLKNVYFLKWIEYAEKENSEILNDIQYYESIKNKSFDLIQAKKELIPSYILEKWNKKIKSNFIYNRNGKEITYNELKKEATKKRKVLSLRNYISKFKNGGLFDILPCWLLTPEVVSDILPLDEGIFDIIIFDEASQIFIEKAIPAIYRANSIVIAGDDKQLQPNSVAKKKLDKFDDIEGDDEEIEDDEFEIDDTVLDEVSLLDIAKKMYKGSLLSYHYRSDYEELINFSNYAFYKGKLIIAPNKDNKSYIPIERIKVDGIWDKRKNIRETEEVYTLVKTLLKERKENESIGIVTFNESQRELIRTYLEEQCEKDPEFSVLYSKEKIRQDGKEDKSIFIKNIENVQGDERDIIIFSIGYAKDIETGRVASRFGTLSQSGGENRLNVAVSRAKKKIYVITSIEPEDLMVETSKNLGPKLFKKYLEYVRAVSNNDKKLAKEILQSLFKMQDITEEPTIHFDSDFEKEVYTSLKDCNYEVHTQVGVSGYKIDLGIYSKEKSEYILGIECDGATYHSSPSARERDVYRQKFLETRGWTIHRIWSKDWWRDPKNEIQKIKNLLENMI